MLVVALKSFALLKSGAIAPFRVEKSPYSRLYLLFKMICYMLSVILLNLHPIDIIVYILGDSTWWTSSIKRHSEEFSSLWYMQAVIELLWAFMAIETAHQWYFSWIVFTTAFSEILKWIHTTAAKMDILFDCKSS